MHYDQSWMDFGFVGGMEAGAISAVVALLLFVFFNWIGRRNGWGYGPQVGWTFLLALVLTASGDMWDLFYFNYGNLQSIDLLKVQLAQVHDPESMGTRVLCEFIGVIIGIYVGWAICSGDWRARIRRTR
jgi:hypothetical protein